MDKFECDACKGEGLLEDNFVCPQCAGEGYFDWIENIVGKSKGITIDWQTKKITIKGMYLTFDYLNNAVNKLWDKLETGEECPITEQGDELVIKEGYHLQIGFSTIDGMEVNHNGNLQKSWSAHKERFKWNERV